MLSVPLLIGREEEDEDLPLPKWEDSAPLPALMIETAAKTDDALIPKKQVESLAVDEHPVLHFEQNGKVESILRSGERINNLDDNLLLFIPESGHKVLNSPVAVPVLKKNKPQELVELDPEILKEVEASGGGQFLYDPKKILTEPEAEDLERLLRFHDDESQIRAFFVLLGAYDKMPSSVHWGELVARWHPRGQACLIVYPVGGAGRVRLFISRDIAQAVAPDYLRNLVQSCLQDALQVSDSVDQLQRFAIQLSIRLIWLERAYPELFQENTVSNVEKIAENESEWLPEVTVPMEEVPDYLDYEWLIEKVPTQFKTRSAMLLALGGVFLVIVLTLLLKRLFRRKDDVWVLPEVKIKRRLGGPHCGGGGATINYG